MNLDTLTHLLEHPDEINSSHTKGLADLLQKYPFFQPLRALHLKALKTEDSREYNKELKRTAACTVDRSMLFEFITSPIFHQQKISNSTPQEDLRNIQVSDAIDLSQQVETEELQKAHTVLDPEFFVPKQTEQETEKSQAREILQEGKPLEFTDRETHSFSEWLKITSFNPIDRSENTPEGSTTPQAKELPPERKRRIKLIDQFIANNPKIKIKAKDAPQSKSVPELKNVPDEQLMTETLARVYVEQKNYKKAKQAYKILSLKYPEKSGFFADQIRAIEELQDYKN